MGIFDKVKRIVETTAELAVSNPEQELHTRDLAAPGDPPTAGAIADAAAQTPEVASASFPDDPDARWAVDRSWSSDGYAIVAATPSTDIGYAQVAFAYRCEGDAAYPVGSYVPGKQGWTLLTAAGDMPATLSES
ncbi:MAG: hypothetical protein R2697_03230 [Ilumatobacteraceae bacterium]